MAHLIKRYEVKLTEQQFNTLEKKYPSGANVIGWAKMN